MTSTQPHKQPPRFLRLARAGLALALGLLLAAPVQAASGDMHLLIGSYTHDSSSPGVLRLRFDPASGQIAERPLQTLASDNPSWLLLDRRRGRLYATNEICPPSACCSGARRLKPGVLTLAMFCPVAVRAICEARTPL